jgi:hypothetical protein
MESWYPFVIGTIIFLYIQSFNRVARIHLESERSLVWKDFFTRVLPMVAVGIEPTIDHSNSS